MKSCLKNVIKSFIFAIFVVLFCIKINPLEVKALTVNQDQIGIYCIKDNGIRANNEWVEIDFEGDYYLEYYFFDLNGYLVMNGTTPDGYTVNERGQWVINGLVQRKHYQLQNLKNNTGKYETKIKRNDVNEYNNGSTTNSSLIIIIAFVLILFILLSITNKSQYNQRRYDRQKRDPDYNNEKQSYKNYNKVSNNDTTVRRNIWWYFRSDTDKKGDEGEDKVAEELKYIGNRFIVLRNINLPRKNKKDVQIDFLCISKKGIYVIEVKNWLGKITGKYEDEKWHSQIYDIINEQTNPVRQNEWHIDVLKRFVKQNFYFYSIIVFTDRADISCLDRKCNQTYILDISNLNNIINELYEQSSVLPYSNYKSIAGFLRKFTK